MQRKAVFLMCFNLLAMAAAQSEDPTNAPASFQGPSGLVTSSPTETPGPSPSPSLTPTDSPVPSPSESGTGPTHIPPVAVSTVSSDPTALDPATTSAPVTFSPSDPATSDPATVAPATSAPATAAPMTVVPAPVDATAVPTPDPTIFPAGAITVPTSSPLGSQLDGSTTAPPTTTPVSSPTRTRNDDDYPLRGSDGGSKSSSSNQTVPGAVVFGILLASFFGTLLIVFVTYKAYQIFRVRDTQFTPGSPEIDGTDIRMDQHGTPTKVPPQQLFENASSSPPQTGEDGDAAGVDDGDGPLHNVGII